MDGNTLEWYTPKKLLYLKLEGSQTIQSLESISQQVLDILELTKERPHILIDITDLLCGYNTADQLRDTQHYMNHANLESAFVVSGNKLNRLIALMAFHVCRVPSMKFNSLAIAENYLKARGLIDSNTQNLAI